LNFYIYKGRAIEDVDSCGIRMKSFPVLGWCLKS